MRKIALLLFCTTMLTGCENLYREDGPPRIRSQGDIDAYNATEDVGETLRFVNVIKT